MHVAAARLHPGDRLLCRTLDETEHLPWRAGWGGARTAGWLPLRGPAWGEPFQHSLRTLPQLPRTGLGCSAGGSRCPQPSGRVPRRGRNRLCVLESRRHVYSDTRWSSNLDRSCNSLRRLDVHIRSWAWGARGGFRSSLLHRHHRGERAADGGGAAGNRGQRFGLGQCRRAGRCGRRAGGNRHAGVAVAAAGERRRGRREHPLR